MRQGEAKDWEQMHEQECMFAQRDHSGDLVMIWWQVTEMLQRIIEAASKLCVGGLAGERAAMIAKLNELEDWQIMAASHKAGQSRVLQRELTNLRSTKKISTHN